MRSPMDSGSTRRAWRYASLAFVLGACGDATPGAPSTTDAGADVVTADAPSDVVTADVLSEGDAPESPPPDVPNGPDDPVANTNPNRWIWVPIEGSKCLNGSPTGVGVNIAPNADGVVFFFMGGGACFNPQTCTDAFHANGFGEATFYTEATVVSSLGPLSRRDPNNPFRTWSYVYIGYCTGDVHAGDNHQGVEIDGQRLYFTGHRNVRLALRRLVPTFRGARRVLLTGVSAGGFGAAYNYDQIATAFGPDVDVSLVDDSGPPLDDTRLAPCLQRTWRSLWNLDATLPADCAACRAQTDGGGLVNMVDYLARKYPTRRLGLVSSTGDDTIRNYYAWGRGGDCNRRVPMSTTEFRTGLLALRERTAGSRFRTYFIESNNHTWILFPGWNTTRVAGVQLNDWVNAIATGEGTAADLGPAPP